MNSEEIYCELRTLQLAYQRIKAELTDTQRKLARSEEMVDHLLDRLRVKHGSNELAAVS